MSKLTVKDFICSWDFLLSFMVSIATFVVLYKQLPGMFAQNVYQTGITILSIVFSVFFAAMAIIISSSDNEFIIFLDKEHGAYQLLIQILKASVIIIFLALMYSVIMFLVTSYWLNFNPAYVQHKSYTTFFAFSFTYSMLCSLKSVLDSLKFASYRVKFLKLTSSPPKKND